MKEADRLLAVLEKQKDTACICTLEIEGKTLDSVSFSKWMEQAAVEGKGTICFVIGGSFGLAPGIKSKADLRLSMSKMTFPHHLARVMLLEQIYRGFQIREGSKYHK